MRIAVVANSAESLLNFRGPLLAEMARQGHDVLTFAPDFGPESRLELAALGVQTVDYAASRSGTNPLRELGAILELWQLFRQHRIELCFSYFIKPVIYGTIAAWLARVPRRYAMIEGLGFAFTEDARQSRTRGILRRVISTLLRFACRRADRVIFLNPEDQNEFVTRNLVDRKKTYLLGPIGLDLNEWHQAELLPGPMTFTLVARLLRDKGVEDYIAAIRILRRQGVEARFLLLGGLDDHPAAIQRHEVEAWVSEGLVEWPGHVAVKSWLTQAHVLVLPSFYREGVPRSIQEAMAMGRAVITTDTPGCRDTVRDGANGWLVPAHDPAVLAQVMRRFIDRPEIIAPMGEESRRIAVRNFDVHRQNARLIEAMKISDWVSEPRLSPVPEVRKGRGRALGWPEVAAGSGLPLYPKAGKGF